jgi:transcriptional regulator with XRE-family HTH domain
MTPENSSAAGETIGQRLKRLRLERGLSQRELAAPGVSYAYISRIEAGTRQPSVKALRRLATKLSVSPDYLETGSDLDASGALELRLSNLELSVRLGEWDNAEEPLQELLVEAVSAGDRDASKRARVALATLAMELGRFAEAVALLEATTADDPFAPVEQYEIYANLGRAYASSGHPERAVELYQRCIDECAAEDGSLAARYATLLSYALSDMGEMARAEEVVRAALERLSETEDPYMRVRLYWSIARLAHTEGRASTALSNVRKAIALLEATDDTFHLARAHILAANITLSRDHADAAAKHLDHAETLLGRGPATIDLFEIKTLRSRIAVLRGHGADAVTLAREALAVAKDAPADQGLGYSALADGLALSGDKAAAADAYAKAVELLESQGRWRPAANACRAWAHMLRDQGRDEEAMDALDRAAELGMRASPDASRVER